MDSGTRGQLGHRPALDGLRGVAILLVMVSHAAPDEPRLRVYGTVGVTVFFTLSGFLITSGLIDEHRATGRLNLRAFWARRIRRLMPALVAFLTVALVASRFLHGLANIRAATFTLIDLANWAQVFGWAHLQQLGPTWSLSIEEQFYALWPLLLMLAFVAGRWRTWVYLLAGCSVAYAAVARGVLWNHGAGVDRIYYGTDTRADALLVGCAMAAWCSSRPRTARPVHADGLLIGLGAFIAGTSTIMFDQFVMPVYLPLGLALVLWWSTDDAYRGLLSGRILRWVGQRSYAFYLWHLPALYVASQTMPNAPHTLTIGLGIAAAWGIAELSWCYVEQPFLRHRSTHAEEPGNALKVGRAVLAHRQPHDAWSEPRIEARVQGVPQKPVGRRLSLDRGRVRGDDPQIQLARPNTQPASSGRRHERRSGERTISKPLHPERP